ncbi:methyl-accepting chemotaxis protein [Solirubrobacter phytolaccae]|uniref:Methyl-accepting chemotaxis protein n=1 Tax=Solirubrobacter phytolaccae TaxID=1404360 RepID=A0A9X3NG32_9ACTN|nr:methyl-accepting chemotaxis protein [Solirubrobacter phytolaccae]MDA0184402.1 methyl-accepting chemotaxis protein [Solirubrobacter phytolaccae]
MSVRTKLFGAFGVVIALMVVLGFVAIAKLGSVNSRAEYLGDTSIPSAEITARVRSASANYRRVQNRLIFATEKDRPRFLKELETFKADTDAQFASYTSMKTDARNKELYTQTKTAWTEFRDGLAGYGDLISNGQVDAAKELLTASQGQLDQLNTSSGAWRDYNGKLSDAAVAEAASTFRSARTMVIILLVVAGLLGVALAFLIARSITRGVGQMLKAAEGIAEGDVEQHINITSKDELGETGAAFERMIAYLKEMAGTADRVAGGDLSVEVNPRSERDLLGNAFNRLVTDLNGIVRELTQEAATVSSASQQMASTSEETGRAVGEVASAISDIARGAERQVRMVESTRNAVQEAARAATASADTASATTEAAEQARGVARDGVVAAERATEAIRQVADASAEIGVAIGELSQRSERIGGIVDTITGIAEQTNLLALNAAIEAARAGEQGRGFAVVAEEVRKLAEESQAAAAQISNLIGEMQTETVRVVDVVSAGAQRTEEGVTTVEQTRAAFEQIGGAVEDMNGRVAEIAAAVAQINAEAERAEHDIVEVASVAEESSASSEQVSASTQQTSASTQEIAASAQSLAGTAEQLNLLVKRFTLV